MQKALGSRTERVRLTSRLTDSPACLVSDHGPSMNLERILKEAGQAVPMAKPVMEINPEHPIVARLKDEADDERFSDWTRILFDQGALSEPCDARQDLLAEGWKARRPGGLCQTPERVDAGDGRAGPDRESRNWTHRWGLRDLALL